MKRKRTNSPVDVFKHIDMKDKTNDECWEWKGKLRKGARGELRPIFSLNGAKVYAYRVVWEQYNGRALLDDGTTKEVVRHRCDNTKCCNPHHLLVGVQRDNVQDMVDRERIGEKHVIIKKIMHLLETGSPAPHIVRHMKEKYDYDIDDSVIRKIRSRRIYKQIPWEWGDKRADEIAARVASDIKRGTIEE